MAKSKGPSKHSRAARRATSPSIDTDKSLKDMPLPKRTTAMTPRPSVLAVHRAAGVSKKVKPARKSRMTSKMRKRHERGLEMAEAVTERTGKKIERSIGRAKGVQRRSRAWEDINKDAVGGGQADAPSGGSRFGALMEDEAADDHDESDGPGDDGDGFNPANPGAGTAAADLDDDDDDIL
ncbi:Ribosome biogenesis protein Alb1 [Metarhizium album ARSEF 1941]|uniref:Ribosome biogenesis protein Alb1 n=1 Tax=Metarhizium album (strain ARSEF 1941) TaxID=1081103 RepID=A0A0B2WDT2_METAS|nr:Ribosome biogenesis protein Alb1 [Metarhizium album ARSEF 1941]KHN94036.1 Ribosome biogenesis protein Alb1 [Metarhizium album ARSEF 1941]